MALEFPSVLVTGGAGYVGSVLVPKLLDAGYAVNVLDLFIYGDNVFGDADNHPRLTKIKGDLRDRATVERAVAHCDAVIHLACISNDPSFDLDPGLGKSINFDCFRPLVQASKDAGVRRFIYASSSSVYGIKEEENVTEDLALEPLTDYSKFKAMCEEVLDAERTPGFETLTLRPATVCGYGRRLRLDLSVNILTNHAVCNGTIKVFGGTQRRPNIHIEDMTDLYLASLVAPKEKIDGQVYNAGYENQRILDIAETVRDVVGRATGRSIEIVTTPTDDLRSYHISSDRIRTRLGFQPRRTISNAVEDLADAFAAGRVPNSMEDPRYFNIKMMQSISLR
ncbi:NAD-dependent epimerase/dehydratase family protein [Roseiterribacter gracilis]|uniref:UDP-glucose 4-epimerase n=1 Tax=Roseiterribacter gracilis TaxID=2812848 RepID=A0A8S8XFS0_9PROT|nr:UDP-glucose 4-epimerase [Rhodospirillales bacterium TMPK1]